MNYFVRILLDKLMYGLYALQVSAQSATNSKTKKADKAFAVEEYNKAAELYKKAYSKTKNRALKAEITFKQAECYRLSGNTKRAESYYKRGCKNQISGCSCLFKVCRYVEEKRQIYGCTWCNTKSM